jgi:hypothetical protein
MGAIKTPAARHPATPARFHVSKGRLALAGTAYLAQV